VAEKGRSTQAIVNSFPDWANVRKDEQSLGYQLINPAGKLIDDLRKQLTRVGDNYFLPTSIISDIDVYYKASLSSDFEFTKDDDDDTDFIFTPPTVSGVVSGGTSYSVTIAENNDIETFWYTPVPSRLSLSTTNEEDHFIASGVINSSPLNPASETVHLTNQLTVTVSGGTSFIGVQPDGSVRRSIIQISGKNREGAGLTEELLFVHDETQKTINEFSEVAVSGIRIYGIQDPDVATVVVTSASFNEVDYPINYEGFDETVTREAMPLFWSLGTSEEGVNTLDLSKYDIDNLELRIQGFTTKQVILQQELLNEEGTNITPLDLAIEPHSSRIWVVDSGNLYIYSDALPYANLSSLEGKNYHANSVIEPNTYYTTIGEEIEVNYVWRRPVQGLVAHRVWLTKPDGTTKSLEDGAEVTYHTDRSSWIYGEPKKRMIRDTEFYTLDQHGDYVFSLEVSYADDTKEIDKRVVSVIYQEPAAQFSLSSLGITNNCIGVDFDSEYNLWVLDNQGIKYKINRHYDKMLIDFSRKIIYFRELYESVQII
jgi:hypothetical protein